MNKISGVLIGIIVILVIALSFVSYKYVKLDNWVKENMGNFSFSVDGNENTKLNK